MTSGLENSMLNEDALLLPGSGTSIATLDQTSVMGQLRRR